MNFQGSHFVEWASKKKILKTVCFSIKKNTHLCWTKSSAVSQFTCRDKNPLRWMWQLQKNVFSISLVSLYSPLYKLQTDKIIKHHQLCKCINGWYETELQRILCKLLSNHFYCIIIIALSCFYYMCCAVGKVLSKPEQHNLYMTS